MRVHLDAGVDPVVANLDGVHQWLLGDVIQHFERWSFKLVRMKVLQAPESVHGLAHASRAMIQ